MFYTEGMQEALKAMTKSDSKSVKRLQKRKKRNEGRFRDLVHMLADESISLYLTGEMSLKEMADDLAKAIAAINEKQTLAHSDKKGEKESEVDITIE